MTINDVLIAAFEKLRARLLPAVLDKTSEENGRVMKAHMDSRGIEWANLDADALSNALYEAVNSQAVRLKWTVLPKRLQVQQQKGVRKLSEAGKETDFAEKVKKAAEEEATRKVEAAAEKNTLQIIASFRLNSARKTEDSQTRLRARVTRSRKSGKSWKDIEADIRNKISELYSASERENEHVGVYRDLLSGVKV